MGGHIADEAEEPRGSLGWLWRIQCQDQAESDIHPCSSQPHVGRAQRRSRRYVGGEDGGEGGEGGGGGGEGGGGGGGDEYWFKLLSNCPVIHQQCPIYYYTNNVNVYKTIDLILTAR